MAMLADPEVDDDDTIEIELTADEMGGLSQAADETQSAKAAPAVRKRRVRLWPLALALPVVGIAAAIMWRPSHPVPPRIAQPPAVSITPPAADQPEVAAPAQQPPLRMKNPFDASEVFQFPAGTTKAEARQKIAQVLLQRAVDRRGLMKRLHSLRRRRTAGDDQRS